MNYPVTFATVGHRQTTLLDRLEQLGDREFYCFIYETDMHNYDLVYYDTIPNLHIVLMSEEYRTCIRMRMFVQEYMHKLGVPIFWMIDDDLAPEQIIYDPSCKSNKRKTTILECITAFEKAYDELPEDERARYGIVGPTIVDMLIVHSGGKKWSGGMLQQCILLNNELLLSHNVKYTGDVNCTEDTEIVINCWRKGLQSRVYTQWLAKFCEKMGSTNYYKVDNIQLGLYDKYGDYVKPGFNKNANHCLFSINWPRLKALQRGKIWDTIVWSDKELCEAAKNRNYEKAREICLAYKDKKRKL